MYRWNTNLSTGGYKFYRSTASVLTPFLPLTFQRSLESGSSTVSERPELTLDMHESVLWKYYHVQCTGLYRPDDGGEGQKNFGGKIQKTNSSGEHSLYMQRSEWLVELEA
jgi:hypothetical protein